MMITQPGNENLKWETVSAANVGLDFRVFNRLSGTVDFYNKKTTDMLIYIPYSYTTGYGGNTGNVGSMVNRGIDIDLTFDLINKKRLLLECQSEPEL